MTPDSGPQPVRRLAFSGTWYDRDPSALARDVDAWLSGVTSLPPGRVCALVAPHAGLRYSGRIAAWSYQPLAGLALDAVVLIGPSHYAAFSGCAMLRRGSLATPWAALPVHAEIADALANASPLLAQERRDVHAAEHSLELHLPLLARVQPGVAVVPILVGEHTRDVAAAIGDALVRATAGRRVVFAASSDLSHYHPRATARRLDEVVLGSFEACDAESLMNALERDPGHACGGVPAAAVMRASRAVGATVGGVRQYGDSGDASGDVARVVGYASAVWTAAA
jgi:AmmeMemoRadiSam system protein B